MDVLNILKHVNRIHKKTSLEGILQKSSQIISDFLNLDVEIWLKNREKNNLILTYPKLDYELHISPENGLLAKSVIQFENQHAYYITSSHPEFLNLKQLLNNGIKADDYIYITPITCYVTKTPKYIGALVVGSKNEISEDKQIIVNSIADNLGTALYKYWIYSEDKEILKNYETKLALIADFVNNKVIPAYFMLASMYNKTKKLKSMRKELDHLKADELWDKVKEIMNYLNNVDLSKAEVSLEMLSEIEHFVKKISDYSEVYVKNEKINLKPVSLDDIIDKQIKKRNITILENQWDEKTKTYSDKKYLSKMFEFLIKGSLKESKDKYVEVLLLSKSDQYRVIIRSYNGGLKVDQFKAFFQPKTVKEYRAGGNGLYFVAANYVAQKLDLDLWLNSPENSGYTEINFNLPKYDS